MYGLKFSTFSEEEHYRLGMKSLERACMAKDTQNRAAQEAPYDPDLVALKQHNKKAFDTLMHLEAKL